MVEDRDSRTRVGEQAQTTPAHEVGQLGNPDDEAGQGLRGVFVTIWKPCKRVFCRRSCRGK
jgi:hypothetical protein